VLILIIGIIIYTIFHYEILSKEEGWGIVAMVGLLGIGILAGIFDLILQRFVVNRIIINLIGLLIVIGLSISILTAL
jgi:hypothetical protein